jgi:hypothetical protein
MALPALAEVADLEERLGLTPGTIAGTDLIRAQLALADASALVRVAARRSWVDSAGVLLAVPDAVRVIVLQSARRSYNNPDNYASEAMSGYSYQYEQGATSAYLTDDERTALAEAVRAEAPIVPGGWNGTGSVYVRPAYTWPTGNWDGY